MSLFEIVLNDESDIYVDSYYPQGMLIPQSGLPNTIWNSYNDCDFDHDEYNYIASFLVSGLCNKKLESNDSIHNAFYELVLCDFPIFDMNDIEAIMKDNSCSMYETVWYAYLNMLEQLTHSYHLNGDRVFQ